MKCIIPKLERPGVFFMLPFANMDISSTREVEPPELIALDSFFSMSLFRLERLRFVPDVLLNLWTWDLVMWNSM
ncbi:unnamed protein product, partial [Mesorhabditis belari]|uniref:Uncharacterized protein n=1 Tax=Mesorhabditis belari TaxID=2138241 RepID=A0AAF3J634_9BILA